MRYKIWATLCLLLVTIAENAIVAQEDFARTQEEKYRAESIQTQHFDENTWNSSIEGLDYTIKRKAPPPPKAKKKRWNGDWPNLGAGILTALKVIAILLFAFILALIIRHYFNAPRNIAVSKIAVEDMSIEDIEEHLEETELSEYKNLNPRWHDWNTVQAVCSHAATVIFDRVCEIDPAADPALPKGEGRR